MEQSWKNNRSFRPKADKPASKPKKQRATKPATASMDGAPSSSMAENVLAKPRKPRQPRKQKTAFTTGELFPAPDANERDTK